MNFFRDRATRTLSRSTTSVASLRDARGLVLPQRLPPREMRPADSDIVLRPR